MTTKIKIILLTLLCPLLVRAGDPPPGVCQGGDHPAKSCKTCEYCYYCGKKGKWGKRPENSATCIVLDKLNAAKAAAKTTPTK